MENNNKIDINTATFLKEILENKKVSIKDFEERVPNLKFDNDSDSVWQFIVIKSFDINFAYLMPLAHHLIDHNYYSVDENLVKYAALNGYQIEKGLESFKEVQDNVNAIMSDFYFEEKMVITNKPAQDVYELAKKIISRSNDHDYNAAKEVFVKAGVNLDGSKLMNRVTTKSKLKM